MVALPFNELAREIYENSKSKGWWDRERNFGETLALIHQELSEAFEEYRQGMDYNKVYFVLEKDGRDKPEGIPVELADVIIRVLEFSGGVGIDIESAIKTKMVYNKTRPYRHGNLRA